MTAPLTVRELIAILSTFDGDMTVAMGMNMEYYCPVTADMVGLSGSEVVIDDCLGI